MVVVVMTHSDSCASLKVHLTKGWPMPMPLACAKCGVASLQVSKLMGACRYFLAKNPLSMARLVAELDAAGLLVTDQCPRPRAFTYADISKLRFLDCVIRVRPAPPKRAFRGLLWRFTALASQH